MAVQQEIRLELDDSKLKGIITELDILHRATAPEIVEFYGAFFIESCVYYCMEFMDAGSLDKLAGGYVPEPVLKKVTASMVRGLKFLKDELQTMHRGELPNIHYLGHNKVTEYVCIVSDVKPTNVVVNLAGQVKLCDFGVSGQLEKSLAKTNIGCQSYMAPERIKGESLNFLGTYTVSSDVWSLGLTIIEFTMGHYPYPPETYSNVFAQLQAIVHGDPPGFPNGYSTEADDFVARCLRKDPNKRPSYGQLLVSGSMELSTYVQDTKLITLLTLSATSIPASRGRSYRRRNGSMDQRDISKESNERRDYTVPVCRQSTTITHWRTGKSVNLLR